ncbi:lasso peptide biosynthesis B2 protein [Clostridium sp. AWRP]|uniref:lasso peptide biosynthesis B2 protein n=1 Tax=Clostridium sp. AWRP TaxID=2212991 RepID=UPI000FD863C3|nr:lasso peptide biosynthesis B2 protein [Clostridium sp. AWRP]AZV56471.1 lasso peptide biosynthesis B2 protein [Clostridium sp. AWRP]
MIQMVYKFIKLDSNRKVLFIQAFIILGISRALVLNVPFKNLAKRFGTHGEETSYDSCEDENTIKLVKWAINTASKFTPWNSNCLAKAITAQKILSKRKIPSTMYFGVAKGKDGLIAHAWLRCGDIYVTGGNENKYTVTGVFTK